MATVFDIIPGLSADSVSTYWPDIAKKLGQGLSDNWSQVVLYTLQSSHLHVYFLGARVKCMSMCLQSLCCCRVSDMCVMCAGEDVFFSGYSSVPYSVAIS